MRTASLVGLAVLGAFSAMQAQSWIKLAPSGPVPSGRWGSSAIYDSKTNQMVIFGGIVGASEYGLPCNELWRLSNANGTSQSAWTFVSAQGTPPPPAYAHSAVYDPASDRMVVLTVGEFSPTGPIGSANHFTPYPQVWVLTNTTGVGGSPAWAQLTTTGPQPPQRFYHSAYYDTNNNRMIIAGGLDPSSYSPLSDVWVLTNANGLGGAATWTQLAPTGDAPGGVYGAYDPKSNRVMVPLNLGVSILTNANGLGGAPAWIPSSPLFPVNTGQRLPVYDSVNNRLVVPFGQNTYILNNANGVSGAAAWSADPIVATFSTLTQGELVNFSAVIDSVQQRLIVFGGRNVFGSSDYPDVTSDVSVLPLPPAVSAVVSATPNSLTFSGAPGGANPPSQTVQLAGAILASSGANVSWTVTSATTAGGTWLSATPASGTTPGNISVGVNATGLAAGQYTGSVTVASGGATATIAVSLTVAIANQVFLTPSSLSFSPGGANIQSVAINSASAMELAWSAAVTTASGGNWLTISTSGYTGGQIQVYVDASALAAGTYQGTITVSTPQGTPATQTVPVTLTVGPPKPALLSVSPSSLTFSSDLNIYGGLAQYLTIGNSGSGTLNWRATVAIQSPAGGNWLSFFAPTVTAITQTSGTASAGSPGSVNVGLTYQGLPPGLYSGTITVDNLTTTEPSKVVSVTLVVSGALMNALLLSQTGLSFTGVEGAGAVPSQTFSALNTGSPASMAWTASAATQSGGNWLSAAPSSASTPASSTVTASVNVSGLKAGQYSGTIVAAAPDADKAPQVVNVALLVLPANQTPIPIVRPAGLFFEGQAGATPLSGQTVSLATASGKPVTATITVNTNSGGNWLSVSPGTVGFSATSPGTFSVVASPAGVAASNVPYTGFLRISFDDGRAGQIVYVSLLTPFGPISTACVASRLFLIPVSPPFGNEPLGYPTQVQVLVVDDCNRPVNLASITATPSNGDPALTLSPIGAGLYEASYAPPARLSLKLSADQSSLAYTSVIIDAFGFDTGILTPPLLFPGGIVDAAAYQGGVLAPGSIVTAFGSNIAGAAANATGDSLPVSLSGASLFIAGQPVPLFYAGNGQVNAQLPYNLIPTTGFLRNAQAVLFNQSSSSVPQTIMIGFARPAIFTADSSGKGQGAVLSNPAHQLVDKTSPAKAGDVVSVYCTGLGRTYPPPPAAGTKTPMTPVYTADIAVTATVGGNAANVQFAGLAPGFVGLYQVNIQIPPVQAGDAVPLVITQNGMTSNTVTIAVR